MQPFDHGPFDRRYFEVLHPAIVAAGCEPYRVDEDPAASIPIDGIEAGIRESAVCVADITVDNPNVWFELGFAIACGKEVVLLCSKTRNSRFPFDIQHRSIITYDQEAPGDFERLGASVTARLKAALEKGQRIDAIAAAGPVAETEGLSPQEISALAIVLTWNLDPDSPPAAYGIREDMAKAGFTAVAAAVAVKSLLRKGYLVTIAATGGFNREDYTGYEVTPNGEAWLIANQEKLALRQPTRKKDGKAESFDDFPSNDDLPF